MSQSGRVTFATNDDNTRFFPYFSIRYVMFTPTVGTVCSDKFTSMWPSWLPPTNGVNTVTVWPRSISTDRKTFQGLLSGTVSQCDPDTGRRPLDWCGKCRNRNQHHHEILHGFSSYCFLRYDIKLFNLII